MANENRVSSQLPSSKSSQAISGLKGAAIGAVTGVVVVAVTQPLFIIKLCLQNNERFSFSPSFLYRGTGVSLVTYTPTVAVQVGAATALHNLLHDDSNWRMTCSFVAGMFSATISTPSELLIANMRETKSSIKTAQYFIKTHGIRSLYRGAFGTSLREGVFTVGFFTAPRLIQQQLDRITSSNNTLSARLAGPIAGIVASIASHPFDTIKNKQQMTADIKPLSFSTAAMEIISKHGVGGLFRGLLPRSTMVVSSVVIIDYCHNKFKV
jgi:hypothetical protein